MSEDSGYRTEHDSMGDALVLAHATWRVQAQCAVENCSCLRTLRESGERMDVLD